MNFSFLNCYCYGQKSSNLRASKNKTFFQSKMLLFRFLLFFKADDFFFLTGALFLDEKVTFLDEAFLGKVFFFFNDDFLVCEVFSVILITLGPPFEGDADFRGFFRLTPVDNRSVDPTVL